MRSDSDIKRDVEDEFRWTPGSQSNRHRITVKNGVVTLSGFVRSHSQEYEYAVSEEKFDGI